MFNQILSAFILFFPAGVANMTPIFAIHIPFLKRFSYPIDCYAKLGKHRIFGDHKTWRGLLTGIFTGTLTSFLLGYGLAYGLLVSFGALAGDAIKSFFKRRANVPSGSSWFPFDQIDFIIGGLIAAQILGPSNPTLGYELTIFLTYFILHLISSYVGYLVKLKDKPI